MSIYLGYLARKKNIVFQIFAILFQVIFDKFIAQYKTFSIIKKEHIEIEFQYCSIIWAIFSHIGHILPLREVYRIGDAPPGTLPNFKYDAPEEVCCNRKLLYSPLQK